MKRKNKNYQEFFTTELYGKFPFNEEKIKQLTVHNNNIPDEEINKNLCNIDDIEVIDCNNDLSSKKK